jgi:hypothetical protein
MSAPSSSLGRLLQQHRSPYLVARPRHRRHVVVVRLPPARPRRPTARAVVLPAGAVHGATDTDSVEGAGKDCDVRELAHRIIGSRRPQALGRARASFWRRRHPRRGDARVLCFGPSDDRVGPPPSPQGGGRCGLATTSAPSTRTTVRSRWTRGRRRCSPTGTTVPTSSTLPDHRSCRCQRRRRPTMTTGHSGNPDTRAMTVTMATTWTSAPSTHDAAISIFYFFV